MSGIAIKRCTLVVQDVRRALAFYRDVVGLAQLQDTCLTMSGKIVPAGLPGAHAHLAVMDAGALELGLLQWTDPPLAKLDDPYPIQLGIGDAAFRVATPDVAAIQARLRHAHEARMHESAAAAGVSFFDADGFFFTLQKAAPAPASLTRATLIVRDAAASSAFYRDTLGMEVVSDATTPLGDAILPAGEPHALARNVVVNARGAELELLCFIDPPLDPRERARHHIGIGDAIFCASADDLDSLRQRIAASPGRLHAPPASQSAAGLKSEATALSFFDPDGHFFELRAAGPH